tara:strand:- start:1015 stop:1578 length:564 start_codon:yes stop_codon:yes gene_type:complete
VRRHHNRYKNSNFPAPGARINHQTDRLQSPVRFCAHHTQQANIQISYQALTLEHEKLKTELATEKQQFEQTLQEIIGDKTLTETLAEELAEKEQLIETLEEVSEKLTLAYQEIHTLRQTLIEHGIAYSTPKISIAKTDKKLKPVTQEFSSIEAINASYKGVFHKKERRTKAPNPPKEASRAPHASGF